MERIEAIERDMTGPSAVEAFFIEAGLPVVEVESCPVPDCEVCAPTMPAAA